MRTTKLAGLVLVASSLLVPRLALAWPYVLNGTANEADAAYAVAVDPLGNPVAAGYLQNAASNLDGIVVKLDAAGGSEIWNHPINGDANFYDIARGVTIDAAGDVLVTGTTQNPPSFFDFTVAKLAGATGIPLWQTNINGPYNNGVSYDGGYAAGVDGSGDVLAVGFTHVLGSAFDIDITAAKLSGATGTEVWRSTIGSAAGDTPDYPHGLAVDPDGNAFVVGTVRTPVYTFVAAKFASADGDVVWRRDIRGTATGYGENFPGAVLATPEGDAIVSGQLHNGGDIALFVAKLAGADGNDVWRHEIGGFGNASDAALDANGDVVAAGRVTGQFGVVKLAGADGAELWRKTLPGTPQIEAFVSDGATSVAVTPTGDVVVGGILDADFTVVKLSGADGSILWQYSINMEDDAYALAYDVAADTAGNAVAGGYVDLENGTEDDLVVVHLDGATGSPLGCGNGSLDPGELCEDGNTVSGDGCDSTCVPTACGNKVVSPGEECDDGNTDDGDGCSAACGLEICGNGVINVHEDCDDANAIDGDGCEDCLLPLCVGGATIDRPRVKLKTRNGSGVIDVRGDLVFAPGAPASGVDPANAGAQVRVEDLGAAGSLLDLTRRTTPIPGSPESCHPDDDRWRTVGASQVYENRSGTLPPACEPAAAGGLTLLKFTDRRAFGRGVGFRAKARGFSTGAPVGPLRVTVTLGAAASYGVDGACGTHTFVPGACVVTSGGTTLRCR